MPIAALLWVGFNLGIPGQKTNAGIFPAPGWCGRKYMCAGLALYQTGRVEIPATLPIMELKD